MDLSKEVTCTAIGVLSHLVVSDSYDPIDCGLPGPLSMEFSRQKYWSGLPFPSQNYTNINIEVAIAKAV